MKKKLMLISVAAVLISGFSVVYADNKKVTHMKEETSNVQSNPTAQELVVSSSPPATPQTPSSSETSPDQQNAASTPLDQPNKDVTPPVDIQTYAQNAMTAGGYDDNQFGCFSNIMNKYYQWNLTESEVDTHIANIAANYVSFCTAWSNAQHFPAAFPPSGI